MSKCLHIFKVVCCVLVANIANISTVSAQQEIPKTPKISQLLISGIQAFERQEYRLSRHILKQVVAEEQAVQAYHLLGIMAADGMGQDRDMQEAVKYWIQAVKKDFPPSLYRLGQAYRYGQGLERIPENAFQLFQKAASRHPGASYEAGVMLDEGSVGEANFPAALKYIQTAATQKFPAALFWMGEAYELGLLESNTPMIKAAEFYDRAARVGSVDAQRRLGDFYARGRTGVPKNPQKAYTLIRLAADTGDGDAQAELGLLHLFGIGTAKTPAMASALFRASSLQGNAKGQFLYGNSLRRQKKIQDAMVEYQSSAKQDSPEALFNLAVIAFKGAPSIPKDYQKAEKLAVRAYRFGSIEAGHLLGVMSLKKENDAVKALVWFRKAARKGHPPSKKAVDDLEKRLSGRQAQAVQHAEIANLLPPKIVRTGAFQKNWGRRNSQKYLKKLPSPTGISRQKTQQAKPGLSPPMPESAPPLQKGLTENIVIAPRLTRTPFLGRPELRDEASQTAPQALPELSILDLTDEDTRDVIQEDTKQPGGEKNLSSPPKTILKRSPSLEKMPK